MDDGIIAALSADGKWTARLVGRDAIATVAQGYMTAFPDMVLVMDSIRDGVDG